MFSSFLLKRVLAELRTDAPQQEDQASIATPPRSIATTATEPALSDPPSIQDRKQDLTLLGQQFVMAEILHVGAEEHYVAITTLRKRHLLRGRIADVEAALSASGGLRIHRSHWVAPQAIVGLRQDRDRMWLRVA